MSFNIYKPTAIISVSDKTNIDKFSNYLVEKDFNIISTGGTYDFIVNNLKNEKYKSNVIKVSDFTRFPEILNGRVKTLHPRIYAGILANMDNTEHENLLVKMEIPKIDLVVVNLYPFNQALEKNLSMEQAIELIDIGGVTLIRAAAKNWKQTLIITDPNDYEIMMQNDSIYMYMYNDNNDENTFDNNKDLNIRKQLASKAFKHTMNYDTQITKYLENGQLETRVYKRRKVLKYGCNPHQNNANLFTTIETKDKYPFEVLNGNLGYINTLDALNSWQLVMELKSVLNTYAVASFKHTSPAGVAVYTHALSEKELIAYNYYNYSDMNNLEKSKLATTYALARNSDPKSSFGDFIALSDTCDYETACLIKKEVSDGIIAPDYSDDALDILKGKKNGNYIILKGDLEYYKNFPSNYVEYRELFGVCLSQLRNNEVVDFNVFDKEENILTKEKEIPMKNRVDILLANITLKYAQSNNVVMARDGQVIGVAAGQQSRVDAVKLAGEKASNWYLRIHDYIENLMLMFKSEIKRQAKTNAIIKFIEQDFENDDEKAKWYINNFKNDKIPNFLLDFDKSSYLKTLNNVSMASDAFFPFRDNIDHASKFGVKYIIQPGGSLADKTVIQACDENEMTMVITGKRMFTH